MSTSTDPQWLPRLTRWGCLGVVVGIAAVLAFCAWTLEQISLKNEANHKRWERSFAQEQVDAVVRGNNSWLDFYSLHDAALMDEMLGKLNGATALERLSFDGVDFNDVGIEQLTDLPNLTTLNFTATHLTDRQLRHLTHLKSVKHLSLESTGTTDEGMAALKRFPNLESLSVWTGDHGLSDAALDQFAQLENLQELTLLGDWFSDAAVEKLREKLPKCEIEVHVKGYESIRPAPLKAAKD